MHNTLNRYTYLRDINFEKMPVVKFVYYIKNTHVFFFFIYMYMYILYNIVICKHKR